MIQDKYSNGARILCVMVLIDIGYVFVLLNVSLPM